MYRCFVYLMSLSLLANCLPIPDHQQTSERGEEGNLFEGDIRLHKEDREKRMIMQSTTAETNITEEFTPEQVSGDLWPNKTVYYKFDGRIPLSLRQTFITAMGLWEYHTCLKFKLAGSNTKAFLNLTEGSCSSYIGRIGTMQEVSISHGCDTVGHAIHELGHAIGLWHEHTRHDRDNYIDIKWRNIQKSKTYNFLAYEHPNMPDVEYDIESIMHYGNIAFAIDKKKPTIELIYKPLPTCLRKMGQRDSISYKDALRVNKMYNCTRQLNSSKTDPCSLPSIHPTPTATSTPSPTPSTSSSVAAPTPTCTVPKAIKSENTITFPFSDMLSSSIGCPGESCLKDNCTASNAITHYYNCDSQYFVIYLASNKRNRHIKSGDTIALKSVKRSNHWVDCSRGNCTLTDCPDNTGKTITNFTRDICSQHKFRIYAVGKILRKRIQVTDTIYLQAIDSDKYLNCLDRKCKLVSEGGDCNEMENSGSSGSLCYKQFYRIEKFVTDCL